MATYATAITAYLDNADFEESQSLTKAKAFVTACVQLSVLMPSSASSQGQSQSIDTAQIAANKDRALNYIAANSQGASVRFVSFYGDFR